MSYWMYQNKDNTQLLLVNTHYMFMQADHCKDIVSMLLAYHKVHGTEHSWHVAFQNYIFTLTSDASISRVLAHSIKSDRDI